MLQLLLSKMFTIIKNKKLYDYYYSSQEKDETIVEEVYIYFPKYSPYIYEDLTTLPFYEFHIVVIRRICKNKNEEYKLIYNAYHPEENELLIIIEKLINYISKKLNDEERIELLTIYSLFRLIENKR